MTRRLLFFLILLLCMPLALTAQHPNRLNYGVKSGFGSTIYYIEDLSIARQAIHDFTPRSEVSWQGSVFLRFNMGRHYLQSECCLSNSRYTLQFPTEEWYDYARKSDVSSISTRLQSIEVPLLYGFHLRQEGDYGMSLFAGPKLCCILPEHSTHTFTHFTHQSIAEVIRPVNAAFVAGFGINIRRLFFDFNAEAGLTNISKQFNTVGQNGTVSTSDIVFHRHKNSVSFSVGLMF